MITKPMLASSWNGEELTYPLYATPKIDGIRALKIDGELVSRSFKPIKNDHIRKCLAGLPNDIDGELCAGTLDNLKSFQETQHLVNSKEIVSDDWVYIAFDWVSESLDDTYKTRMACLHYHHCRTTYPNTRFLFPKEINSLEELVAYEQMCISKGYEGVILRSGDGPYKCGRATVKEGYMLKVKRFDDAEAKVVGFVELEHNNNEAEKDNFGRTKRSDKKEGKVGAGVLGKFILELPDGKQFGCGTGLSAEQRKEIWENKDSYLGKLVKYKYFAHGEKDLPRHPVFLGFRDEEDLS
jgi:DNA ligase-1